MGNSGSNEVKGPLDLWTFPVLNALISMSSDSGESSETTTETAKVIRDSNGEVQEVVVIKE